MTESKQISAVWDFGYMLLCECQSFPPWFANLISFCVVVPLHMYYLISFPVYSLPQLFHISPSSCIQHQSSLFSDFTSLLIFIVLCWLLIIFVVLHVLLVLQFLQYVSVLLLKKNLFAKVNFCTSVLILHMTVNFLYGCH